MGFVDTKIFLEQSQRHKAGNIQRLDLSDNQEALIMVEKYTEERAHQNEDKTASVGTSSPIPLRAGRIAMH
jgi:hypothetical protein